MTCTVGSGFSSPTVTSNKRRMSGPASPAASSRLLSEASPAASIDVEEEAAKRRLRRSSFNPGRKSLVMEVVSHDDSGDEDVAMTEGDSMTEEKMRLAIIYEVINEHKQEQLDWNNFIRTERRKTEELLNERKNLVITFGPDDEPPGMSEKHRDFITKGSQHLEQEIASVSELHERLSVLDERLETVVNSVELLAERWNQRLNDAVGETTAAARETARHVEKDLLLADSGIGIEPTSDVDL